MTFKNIILIILISVSNLFSQDKITLQLDWLHQFQFAGYYVAKEKGFYQEKNLNVTIKELNKNVDLVENVLKSENIYSIGKSSLVIDKLNDKDIVLLAAIYQSSPMTLITLKSSNINTLHDLKNKKVMLTHDAKAAASVTSMIKSQNINLDNIHFMPHSFNLDDLINGKTDAMGCYLSNEPFTLKSKNIEFNLFTPSDYGFDFYSGVLFTSTNELNTNPQRVKNFYDASIKGWNYAFSNIEETAKLIYEKYNTQNKTLDSLIYEAKILEKLAKKGKIEDIGSINSDKIEEIKRLYLVLGLANNNKINLDDFIFNNKKVTLNSLENKFIKESKFTLITHTNRTPYSFKQEDTVKGIETDLLKLVSDKMGTSYNIIEEPENINILNSIKTNSINFGFNYSKNDIDLDTSIYSKPILNISMALATRQDKNLVTNLDMLPGQKLAILKGSNLYKKLKYKHLDIDFIQVETKEEGFKLVENNTVYGFIDDILSLSYSIIKNELHNIKISGILPYNLEMRIVTNKDNYTFINIINKIIPFIEKNKKEEILKQYQLILIKEVTDYSWIYKFIIPLLFAISIISLFNSKMRKEIKKRRKAEENLKVFANNDSLTGIFNRGKIDKTLNFYIKRSKNMEEVFSIIFFDIDNFKQINDDFGHIKGDDVLIKISSLVKQNIRETDVFGRWGGEEFIIILPNTTSDKASILADNLRELISKYDFNINRPITVSLGVTEYSQKDTKEKIVHRVDEAMYFVKTHGKNAVKIL